MKKLLLLIYLFSGSIYSQYMTQEKTEIKKIKDLGIHYESIYQFETSFGKIDESTKFLASKNEYNEAGQLIKAERYYRMKEMKEFESVNVYHYNEDDYLEKTVVYKANGEIKHIIKESYENGLNNKREVLSSYGDVVKKIIFSFNKSNKVVENEMLDSKNNLMVRNTYKYDKENNLIQTKTYDKNNKLESIDKYTRKNNIITREEFNIDGKSEFKSIEKFNDNNLIVEKWTYFPSGYKPSKEFYEYDNNELVTKITEMGRNGEPKEFTVIERTNYWV